MTQSELRECLRGISAVMITPFDESGAVDLGGVEATADFLVRGGMRTIVPLGNTGEFYGLTTAEARAVVEATVGAVDARAAVVVGVGHSPVEAGVAAEHAADVGADAAMVHQPANPYVTDDGLRAYYATVSERSGLPLVPYVKTPALRLDELVAVAALPGVAGIKYAVNDLPLFASAVARTRDSSSTVWVCGTAETWAPFFFAAGAEGFTSGLVNVTTGPSLALLDALRDGDRERALELWAGIRPFEELRALHGDGFNVSVVKEALRQLGRPAGGVRPPASAVGAGERRAIASLLAAWELSPLEAA